MNTQANSPPTTEKYAGYRTVKFRLKIIFSCLTAIVLLLNAAGWIFQQGFAGYLIGLLWGVVASSVFFARLVYLGLSDADPPESS